MHPQPFRVRLYEETTLIMQLLRDNLTLWTCEQGQEQGQAEK